MGKKDKGCTAILIIGILIGIVTGVLVGMNYATWKYANIISIGYSEIIRTQDGGMFVKEKGLLYRLEEVKVKDSSVEKKIIDAIEKHDQNMIEVEKAEIYHDSIKSDKEH